jgi:hypothetical protein
VVVLVARIHRSTADVVHAALLGALVGLLVAQMARGYEGMGTALFGWGAALGAFALFLAWPPSRAWPRLLSIVAPLSLVLFFGSPSGTLVRATGGELPARQTNGRSVVLIVFDELPVSTLLDARGDVDASRFPSFARLASRTEWYRDTTTVAPGTEEAVPAILTGRLPDGEVAPTIASHPENLFTMLAPTYDMHVYEHLGLCPKSCGVSTSGSSVDRELDLLADSAEVLRLKIAEEREVATFEFGPEKGPQEVERMHAFAGDLRGHDGSPTVYFLHAILPHKPFQYLPSGDQYEAGDIMFGRSEHPLGDATYPTRAAADFLYRRHLAQLMYTDELLGEILDAMDAADVWDDAVVVVTADHGEAFIAGEPRRRVTSGNLEAVAHVPLFVGMPGAPAGTTNDDPMRTIDILPTIATALDADVPFAIDGRLDGSSEREMRTTHSGTSPYIEIDPLDGAPIAAPGLSVSPFAPRNRDDLLGRTLDDVGSADECVGRVDVEERVPDGNRLTYVVGEVAGLGAGSHDVVLSAGGRIAGVTRTFPYDGDPDRFGALLDPAVVGDGTRVDAHVFTPRGEQLLTPLCAER